MDMDLTLRNMPLDDASILSVIRNICSIDVQDDVSFEVLKIEPIREGDTYGGIRVYVSAHYDVMNIIFILTSTQPYDMALFKKALAATAKHRGSAAIINEMAERVAVVANSRELRMEWEKYRKLFSYASGITYDQFITSLKNLCNVEDVDNA